MTGRGEGRLQLDGWKILRFSIADGMILVAAIAAGLAGTRACLAEWGDYVDRGDSNVGRMIYLAAPSVLACTIGLLLIGLRRRDMPLRRWLRRPGMSACVATLAFGAVDAAMSLVRMVTLRARFGATVFIPSLGKISLAAALSGGGRAVAACWVFQALSRTWWPSPDWVDRIGRLLGVFLIAAWLLLNAGV